MNTIIIIGALLIWIGTAVAAYAKGRADGIEECEDEFFGR
jgi:hypothetical protein